MVNSVLQIVGCIVSTIGGICVLITTFLPQWRRNDPSDELLEAIVRHQGIWVRCVSYPTGLWQCDDFDAFFIGLPPTLQVARGLCCTAIGLGFFAYLLSMVGMQCTDCLGNDHRSKSRIAMASGLLWILSGFCVGAAVSYYSYQILTDYNRDLILFANDLGQKYVYGASLFVGWAALVICFVGGIFLICGSIYSSDQEQEYRAYRPKAYHQDARRAKRSHSEYV